MRLQLTLVAATLATVNTHANANTIVDGPSLLETVTVTATRDEARLADTAASVGVLNEAVVAEVNATHAADLLNRIPGVNIAQLGSSSQGTTAAIRQPVSYGPVYLYLENGVPTRSPAFFNHNALYAMNVAQASGMEVTKGPGSALYGSDAIGGVVNLISAAPQEEDALGITLEGGDDGWRRLQLNADKVIDGHSFTAKFDTVDSEGWRDNTDFTRNTLTTAWHTRAGEFDVSTVFTGTVLDMHTGGSGLNADDFKNNPALAGNLVGYRDVRAFRLSSAWERQFVDGSSVTITPYLRNNDLKYIATWTLNTGRVTCSGWGPCGLDSQDAHINKSGHSSAGVLLKYRQDIAGLGSFSLKNAFWIAGLDLDYSHGYTEQAYIIRTDSAPGDYWLSYEEAGELYDYDVDFSSVSPYIHAEADLTDRLRLSAGLRYDSVRYNYDNKLSVDLIDPIHKRPADTTLTLEHLSPKLGLTYDLSETLNAYAAYRHAFRIPSSGQLFRAGKNINSTDLDPVTANSYELGLRGQLHERIDFELAYYYMVKEDDILNSTDAFGARQNVNAGTTKHRGLELGFDVRLLDELQLGVSYTRSQHRYEDWQESASKDYSGNEMMDAPRSYANVRLEYRPALLNGGRIEAEWIHQGAHYINELNSANYDGHDLINLRASYQATPRLQVYANLLNAADEHYAETTGKWGPTYTPGRSRSVFAGIKYEL